MCYYYRDKSLSVSDKKWRAMRSLKPITMNEVVGGQTYIRVGVDIYNRLWMKTQVLCGQPYMMCGSWWMSIPPKSDWDLHNWASMSDGGMDPSRRTNRGSTFRFTGENMKFLSDLVERNALDEYLALVGL